MPESRAEIPGLGHPNEKVEKGLLKTLFYRIAGGTSSFSPYVTRYLERQGRIFSRAAHRHWHEELENELKRLGLLPKLKRCDHHLAHAANSYLASGFDRALIVTLDGYGSGLAASVSIGEGGKIKRLHNVRYPNSLGIFYETVTSSLGFKPSRHEGKIVGLAAYGDPRILSDILLERFDLDSDGYRMFECQNIYFSRHIATRLPKIDVAAAYQNVLEIVACDLVRKWLRKTGCNALVLSGGVAANVKMNQRVYDTEGVERAFIYPNMGDGGCASGLALYKTWPGGSPEPIEDVYFGPSFTQAEIRAELDKEGLAYQFPGNLAAEVARRVHEGQVVARFSGRMEYGPRAPRQPFDLVPREGSKRKSMAESAFGTDGVHALRAGHVVGSARPLLPERQGRGARRAVYDHPLRLHGVDEGAIPGRDSRRRYCPPSVDPRGQQSRVLRDRERVREAVRYSDHH